MLIACIFIAHLQEKKIISNNRCILQFTNGLYVIGVPNPTQYTKIDTYKLKTQNRGAWGSQKDFTKPRQTIQSHYKAPTDYTKPPKHYTKPQNTIQSPRKTVETCKILDKTLKYSTSTQNIKQE